ncbi:MAG: protein-L-isoaspartate O-methyltransferase [Alphaproteobacteria bacterium]
MTTDEITAAQLSEAGRRSAAARRIMVECQIRAQGVRDERILAAMAELPREAFLAGPRAALAYVDEDLPLDGRAPDGAHLDGAPAGATKTAAGGGQAQRYLMEPSVLARLLEAGQIKPDDIALDVGCGTGYATALLARLTAGVVGLESDARLAEQAERLLVGLSVDNAAIVRGPLTLGYSRQAPYDVILINGAIRQIPPALEGQLADGGRLLAVVRDAGGLGRATVFRRTAVEGNDRGRLTRRIVFDAATPDLADLATSPAFAF